MATQENITSRQLELARKALWHQGGSALNGTTALSEWLDTAGLVPVYPHAQFATPAPSFAEAVLGRPENGWMPAAASTSSDLEETVEEDFDDADGEEKDEEEPSTGEGDEAMLAGDGNIPGDRETMLSDDDEFAEDEGDEIAEEDRIDAEGNPVPNDLQDDIDEAPASAPVNGFTAEERETVHRALARLVEDGSAVPLSLLGSNTGEPDYLVSAAAFSFVYTLRGDKNWKSEPATTGAMRVSPLAVKVYNLLREQGAMASHELTSRLGSGITDSATLRALSELWAIQRVLPLPDGEGRPAKWEVTTARFLRHMKAGANAGQPTALSALLSLYLSQAIAATGDEMEVFLSPLAARSRIREVVNGLSASRQLEPLVVEGKTLLHIAGALPELPGDDSAQVEQRPQRSRYAMDDLRADMNDRSGRESGQDAHSEGSQRRVGQSPGGERGSRFQPRPGFGGGGRPAFARGGDRGGFSPRRSFGEGAGSSDRERRPFQRRDEQGGGDRPERPSYARPWDEERSQRPFQPREGGERRPFAPRGDRPFQPREGGDRRPFTPRGDRPFTPREGGERRPFSPRGDRPFTPREGGERRPFAPRGDRPFQPREGGERRPFAPRGDRPFSPRGGDDRRPFSPRGDRPFTPREGGENRPFAPRGDRPFSPRDGGDRRPFSPRGDRPFTPREGGERRPFAPRGDRPFAPRENRPFTPREGGSERPGGFGRPSFGGGRKPFGEGRPQRDRFSGEPGEGRPSFQSGAHSAGPGGSKFGGSGFGRDRGGKPGGFGRPGGKPSFRGPGSGPARGGAPKRRPE